MPCNRKAKNIKKKKARAKDVVKSRANCSVFPAVCEQRARRNRARTRCVVGIEFLLTLLELDNFCRVLSGFEH